MDNEADILAGRFDVPLLQELPARDALDALIENARQRIYCAPEVVEYPGRRFPGDQRPARALHPGGR